MSDPYVTGLFSVISAIAGGALVFWLNQSKRRLEKALLRAQIEKLELEIKLLKKQQEIQLTSAFWQNVAGLAERRSDDVTPTWQAFRDAFLELTQPSSLDQALLSSAQALIQKLSSALDRRLPEGELVTLLRDTEREGQHLDHRTARLLGGSQLGEGRPTLTPPGPDAQREERSRDLQQAKAMLDSLRERLVRFYLEPGARLLGRNLSGLDLSGMDLGGVQLRGCDLRSAALRESNLQMADLSDAYLAGAKMVRADLQRALLFRADLSYADLRDANLDQADLRGSVLMNTDLTGASLLGADLQGARYSKGMVAYHDTKWPAGFDPVAAGAKAVTK